MSLKDKAPQKPSKTRSEPKTSIGIDTKKKRQKITINNFDTVYK